MTFAQHIVDDMELVRLSMTFLWLKANSPPQADPYHLHHQTLDIWSQTAAWEKASQTAMSVFKNPGRPNTSQYGN
jgi:hypothetical protein